MMQNNPDVPVGTLVKRITRVDELENPNIPKVVLDKNFFALYFSRSIIPFYRDIATKDRWIKEQDYFQHIGLYIYRREFLLKFVALPASKLEKIEQLEQLRILENGYKIKAAVTEMSSIGVDVPEDIERVEAYLSGRVI
jgi:3-deoxy-manno-octulosonate cytidylyltransferase (CMP-KDO synthetase)